jgi:phenylalanyl-tRNA synthetase beta chain
MKFTLSWLKDHLDTAASQEVLAAKLSAIGLDVERIEQPAKALEAFTLARVIEAKRHPNADKLQVCAVETGSGVVDVVCGAPNAKTGMIGVFAPIGSYIPGTKITLDKRPVRGVVSYGMLVSAKELELSEDHTGIIELSGDYASRIGERYIDVLGLGDPVFDVKLTPNRPDCTGVRGIARDLAAAGMGQLKPDPKIAGVEGKFDCPIDIKLDFPEPARAACSCFAGRYLRGVSNGASPAWMQRRLKAIGLRPINALVDVTNYISIDRGRPLHVYDADKLNGAIRARLGRAGETFRGLDGKTHAVDATMCVIADERAVLGLGGILGGEDTGCTPATKNVLIECAYFDPLRTAATGRTAGIQSDARYRFERGVDPAFLLPGLDLATAMMLDAAGGTPSKAKVAGAPPLIARVIDFPFGAVARLAGLALPPAQIRATLEALGFTVDSKGEPVKVIPPSWRPDVHGCADLVEEVVRIVGLDKVPSTAMARAGGVARPVLTTAQRRRRHARRVLAARGLVEAITWSFVARDAASHFGGGRDELELANAISSEMTSMRPSLLPGLLAAVARNRNRGFGDVALFEIGQAYRGEMAKDQFMAASGVRSGAAGLTGTGRHWSGAAGDASVFDAKADVFALLAGLGFDAARAQLTRDAPAWFHPGRSATLRLGPKVVLAQFGELHPDTLRTVDIAAPTAVFEVFIDALPVAKKALSRHALVAADLLPVHRDFAFVLPKDIAAGDVIKAALAVDKKLITAASVFDVFEGTSLGEGKKSLALEVTLQPTERTLRDEDIEAVAAKIIAAVRQATGGEIRS